MTTDLDRLVSSQERSRVPLLVFAVALTVFVLTRTQVHTFDALSYVLSVERKPLREVLFPHHLVYGPLSQAAAALGGALGIVGAALPMQLLSALGGAVAVTAVWTVAWRQTARTDLALLAALLTGGSFAFWYFAGETDVYAPALGCALLALLYLARLSAAPRRRDAVWLGVWQSLAILLHQSHVLLTAAALTVALGGALALRRTVGGATVAGRGATTRDRPYGTAVPALWWPYPLVGVAAVGGAYGLAAWAIGFADLRSFQAWFSGYLETGWWGTSGGAGRLADTWTGLSETLGAPWGVALVAALAVVAAGAWLAAGHAEDFTTEDTENAEEAKERRSAADGQWSVVSSQWIFTGTLWVWLAVYAAAALWWEPSNPKFWLPCVPALALLCALGLRRTRPWRGAALAALALAGALVAQNGPALLRRGDAATDLDRVIAGALAARLRPADVALVPDGLLEVYLPYYHQYANPASLNAALFESNGDWERACGALRARIDAAQAAGAQALLAEEALRPPERVLARFGLTQAAVAGCFAPYAAALQPVALPPGVPPYLRLPTADERAAGAGWHFASERQGWTAANVSGEAFDGAWRFVPGSDPALLSPLLTLDAARVSTVSVTLRNGTAARDAQLFFAGPDGQISEARSVRWTLRPGSGWETYAISVRGAPGWSGVIARVRIDPVGAGDGGEIAVRAIRIQLDGS